MLYSSLNVTKFPKCYRVILGPIFGTTDPAMLQSACEMYPRNSVPSSHLDNARGRVDTHMKHTTSTTPFRGVSFFLSF